MARTPKTETVVTELSQQAEDIRLKFVEGPEDLPALQRELFLLSRDALEAAISLYAPIRAISLREGAK